MDCKGDCRMLGPGEMESLIANGNLLAAELVQPRLSIVRLYHEGQRVGYLPPGGGGGGGGEKVLQGSEEASPLPPARLHLGSERLALTTVVSKSSFAIQDP